MPLPSRSPDSSDSPNRPSANRRHASSSPETSSGPDDADDLSLSEDIQVDRPEHPDEALGAAARTTPANWPRRPVYEIVEDFTMGHDGEGTSGGHEDATNVEIGVDVVGDVDEDSSNAVPPTISATIPDGAPTAPIAPPSYDEVMAFSANGRVDEIIDAPQTEPSTAQTSFTTATTTTTAAGNTATTPTSTTTESTRGVDVPGRNSSPLAAAAAAPAAAAPPAVASQGWSHLSTPAASEGGSNSQSSSPNRFTGRRRIRLEELDRVEDMKEMTPRQLKEILVANFVAYKGCCERWELEDRVKRLWNEHKANQEMLRQTHERDEIAGGGKAVGGPSLGTHTTASSASSKQPSLHPDVDSQLCKICWDAVIDCVLLECGHMVTCTDCGRRMAECPMCRQYVVRAVHVFRA